MRPGYFILELHTVRVWPPDTSQRLQGWINNFGINHLGICCGLQAVLVTYDIRNSYTMACPRYMEIIHEL